MGDGGPTAHAGEALRGTRAASAEADSRPHTPRASVHARTPCSSFPRPPPERTLPPPQTPGLPRVPGPEADPSLRAWCSVWEEGFGPQKCSVSSPQAGWRLNHLEGILVGVGGGEGVSPGRTQPPGVTFLSCGPVTADKWEEGRGRRRKTSEVSAGRSRALLVPRVSAGEATTAGHSVGTSHARGSNQAFGSRGAGQLLRATQLAPGLDPSALLIPPPKRMRVTRVQAGAAPPEPPYAFLPRAESPLPESDPPATGSPEGHLPPGPWCPGDGNLGDVTRGVAQGLAGLNNNHGVSLSPLDVFRASSASCCFFLSLAPAGL